MQHSKNAEITELEPNAKESERDEIALGWQCQTENVKEQTWAIIGVGTTFLKFFFKV